MCRFPGPQRAGDGSECDTPQARSLFRQFKKDRGYSPADFAKRVRLGHAREMLEQSSDGASVIQVALKCGFQNPGRFARDYRSLFRELPSATLQESRKLLGYS